MLEKLLQLLQILSWKRYFLATVFTLTGIISFTFYENRQQVYEVQFPAIKGDYELREPSARSKQHVYNFMKRYPNVGMLTIIDADPVRNRRRPVFRTFNDETIRQVVDESYQRGNDGSGPLFSSDESANQQILSILSGEVRCDPVESGVFANLYPNLTTKIVYSCRVPIPPAFQHVTGWIAIHLTEWPPNSIDALKQDALALGLSYYESEINN